jgi:hypothetical protein
METSMRTAWFVMGFSIFAGLLVLGFFINRAVETFKGYERVVTVRGLSEQEHAADIVIWPIQFTEASNSLEEIYTNLESSADKIIGFLTENGIARDEISLDTPLVTDRSAQRWGGESNFQFRYVASQVVTVYSNEVIPVREVMNKMGELGKRGIAISGEDYQYQTEYIFSRLNDVKPTMIEEATMEARKVAQKFAEDSDSKLGKIKTASQGQFSITPRDKNNPHIKNIRVVSTIVYYLTD